MITGNATGVPSPAHLPQLPQGCMNYSDRRLDRSEIRRRKIFNADLNLQAPGCD
jgi:hypothetical protein